MLRVVLDACVLFPLVLRDTLLDAAAVRLYVPLWTDDILDELRRNLVEDRGLSPQAAGRLIDAMAATFPDARVAGYRDLIPAMTNHPKDRHVLAAAVNADADGIVTNDLKDFSPESVAPFGIVPLSPDGFFRRLFDASPKGMVNVITGLAATYRNPPLSIDDVVSRLAIHAPSLPRQFKLARQ